MVRRIYRHRSWSNTEFLEEEEEEEEEEDPKFFFQRSCVSSQRIRELLAQSELVYHLTTGLLDLDAGRLARSQNPEGPATGHLDPGFLGFPGS